MRRCRLRAHHVLRRAATHVRERHDLVLVAPERLGSRRMTAVVPLQRGAAGGLAPEQPAAAPVQEPERSGAGAGHGWSGRCGRPPGIDHLEDVFRVIRPPTPVPVTSAALIALSAKSFRTTGERTSGSAPIAARRRRWRCVGSGAGCRCRGRCRCRCWVGGAGAGVSSAAAGGCRCSAGAGARRRRRCWRWRGAARPLVQPARRPQERRAAGASSPMTASRTPTSTVSPSGTRISVKTPAAGEGTSESTLSVETSKRGSSRATVSPMAFIHRVTVPSVTVSPNCGIVTSANVHSPSGQRQHRLAE